MTEFPQTHRTVPRLLDQEKRPACFAYAIAMCMEAELKEQSKIVNLDPLRLYKETTADGRPPHLTKALQYAKDIGVWDLISKQYIKIKSFKFVARAMSIIQPDIISEINKGKFIIISLDIGNTTDFKALTVEGVVQPKYKNLHAVVGVDTVKTAIVFANTWGEDYGKSGYGLIDIQFGGSCKGIEKGYSITL